MQQHGTLISRNTCRKFRPARFALAATLEGRGRADVRVRYGAITSTTSVLGWMRHYSE